MLDLITNRTQENVDMLRTLQAKGWNNFTESEKTIWTTKAAKGAYNHTDLNRVETAVAKSAEIIGLELIVKTDWTVWDLPTPAEMKRYLGNIVAIRNACPYSAEYPTLPSNMEGLTYEAANNIERTLIIAWKIAESSPRSGEIYSGEV